MNVILYHYPCPDGVWAAWCAHRHFKQRDAPARYVPHRVYEALLPEALQLRGDETCYLLDYVGPTGLAAQLAGLCRRVVVLDHHKTAADTLQNGTALPGNLEVNLDMQRSGARLALDYFQPQVTEAQRRMIDWVQDADLWAWRLVDSRAFHSGLGALELEYDAGKNPAIFDTLAGLDPQEVVAKGRSAMEEDDKRVAGALAAAFRVKLGGSSGKDWGDCLAVRADDLAHLRSQLGNELAAKSAAQGLRAIGLVAYVEPEMGDASKVKCSLRSIGTEDTTEVTAALGGGGHLNASSCIIVAAEFESWRT